MKNKKKKKNKENTLLFIKVFFTDGRISDIYAAGVFGNLEFITVPS